eukprot:scaffold31067_cov138-Isochrysis_galbana.AAC.3
MHKPVENLRMNSVRTQSPKGAAEPSHAAGLHFDVQHPTRPLHGHEAVCTNVPSNVEKGVSRRESLHQLQGNERLDICDIASFTEDVNVWRAACGLHRQFGIHFAGSEEADMSGISVTAQARQEPAAVWPGATGSPLLSMACMHARTHATGAEASQPPIAACGRTGRSEAGLVRMQTQSQR